MLNETPLLVKLNPSRRRKVGKSAPKQSNKLISTILYIKSFVGMTGISVGYFFSKVGVIPVLTLYPIILIISIVLMNNLSDVYLSICEEWGRKPQNTGEFVSILNPVTKRVFGVSIIACQYCLCMAYIILFCNELSSLMNITIHSMFLFCSVPLILINLFPSLVQLSFLSFVGSFLIFSSILTVFGSSLFGVLDYGLDDYFVPVTSDVSSHIFTFMGACVFTFEGTAVVVVLMNAFKEPKYIKKLNVGVLTFLCCLFIATGLLVYGRGGTNVPQIVPLMLGGFASKYVFAASSFALFLTHPLMAATIYDMFEKRTEKDADGKAIQLPPEVNFTFIIRRVGIVVSMLFSAYLLRNQFGKVNGIVSSSFGSYITLIAPAQIHMKFMKNNMTPFQRLIDWIGIILGVILIPIGTWEAIIE
ncbi:hypothetical protein PCE1_003088 [Barthelona sp. PCE]